MSQTARHGQGRDQQERPPEARTRGSDLAALALAAALFPAPAHALDFRVEAAARGWFFAATGDVEGTDLETLGFDRAKGQPEIRAGVTLNDAHHLGVTYLRIRREESGTVSGTILGIFRFENDVSLDLSVDDVRVHYGYSVVRNDWLDLEPFVEVGYFHEDTVIVNRTTGEETRSDEELPLPLPGVALTVAPGFPVHPLARVEGMSIGIGHLIDATAGAEGVLGPVFLGAGYRYANLRFDRGENEQADVRLRGAYVEGGVRF